MLIRNVKSSQDLGSKKQLQSDLLDLEVANEAELEKRVKDFKNPNKPLPVAPEYKTNAQLQKDRLEQEKTAIKNMEELGFDYGKSAELVAWLSSSIINKLVEFNANFKGIKKELVETTNPKLISLEFIKNYLEKYFEDIDVNYGRKFSNNQITQGQTNPATIDDLQLLLPSPQDAEGVRQIVIELAALVTQEKRMFITRVADIRREIARNTLSRDDYEDLGADEKREYKTLIDEATKVRNTLEKDVAEIGKLSKDLYTSVALLEVYASVIPDDRTLSIIKTSLTQKERQDLIRRYISVLRTLNVLSRDGLSELRIEAGTLLPEEELHGDDLIEPLFPFARKLLRAMSFVSSDAGVNQILKLDRDFEVMVQQSGKIGELEQLKQLNDIRQQKVENAKTAFKEVLESAGEFDRQDLKETEIAIAGADPFNPERRRVAKLQAEIDEDTDRNREVDLGRALIEQEYRGAIVRREKAQKQKEDNELFETARNRLRKTQAPPQEKDIKQGLEEALVEHRKLAQRHYTNFVREIDEVFDKNEAAGYNTMRKLVEALGMTPNPKGGGRGYDEVYQEDRKLLVEWLVQNRIRPLKLDTDFMAGRQLATFYTSGNQPATRGKTETTIGLGINKQISKLKSHFKEDEMLLKRILKSHIKRTDPLKKAFNDSDSDEEKGMGVSFKHTRIKVGSGIAVKQTPSYRSFGKYVIHFGHLLDKNVANFKYPSLGSIPHIKPMTITDDYKDFIIDTLDNGRPNERLLNKLPEEEQRHFEKVVTGAGLLDTFKLKKNISKEQSEEANRFNLLRGEILAGNNSEKVVKELRALIVRFMNDGRIHKKQGLDMLMELSVI